MTMITGMDEVLLLFLNIPTYVLLSGLALLLLYWYGTSTFSTFKKMGVPSLPYPMPFIGHLYHISMAPEVQVGAKEKKTRETYGKIFGFYQGTTPVVYVSDADAIKQITIKEFQTFTNRQPVFDNMNSRFFDHTILSLTDDHWKHVRTLLTPIFSSGKLKTMFKTINKCADKMVENISQSNSKSIAIRKYTAGYTMDVIAQTVFGLDMGAQDTTDHPFVQHAGTFFGVPRNPRFWSEYKLTLDLIAMLVLPPFLKRLYGKAIGYEFADHESEAYIEATIKQAIKLNDETNGQSGFLKTVSDQVVDLKEVDPESVHSTNGKLWTTKGITENELLAGGLIFLTAGYDSTASTFQFFTYCMAVHPEIQQQLFEEIYALDVQVSGDVTYEQINQLEYLDCCIHETMRMYPPFTGFDRVASQDVEISGIKIPRGTFINIPSLSVHYDPEYWPEPYTFSPDRFLPQNRTPLQKYTWLPFGLGNRSCIAMRLALLELKVAAYKLMKQYRIIKTADTVLPEELEYTNVGDILQTKAPLMVGMEKRQEQ